MAVLEIEKLDDGSMIARAKYTFLAANSERIFEGIDLEEWDRRMKETITDGALRIIREMRAEKQAAE